MAHTYKCRICGESKESFGPRPDNLCDGCWELEIRIKMQPDIARRILECIEQGGEKNK